MKSLISISLKSFFCKKHLIILSACSLLALGLLLEGVAEYRNIPGQVEHFKTIERETFQKHQTFSQYWTSGFHILHIPPVISVFFHKTGTFNTALINADARVGLQAHSPLLNGALFDRTGALADFSGYALLLCSIISSIWGFDTFRRRGYLSFILHGKSVQRFPLLAASRLLPLLVYFITLYAGGVLLVYAVVPLSLDRSLVFLLIPLPVLILNIVFFFFTGVAAASVKSMSRSVIILIFAWVTMVFVAPYAVNKIIRMHAKLPTLLQIENKKLDFITRFQKRAQKQGGVILRQKETSGKRQKLLESYRHDEYEKIQTLEQQVKIALEQAGSMFYFFSSITPTTFYFSVCDGVSSGGILSFLAYHDYVMKLDRTFIDFFLSHSKQDSQKVESFIKNNENIYISKAFVPLFWPGLLLSLFYAAGLYYSSFRIYAREFQQMPPDNLKDPAILLKEKQDLFIVCKNQAVKAALYRRLDQPDNTCLGKIDHTGLKLPGIKPYDYLQHLCRMTGSNFEQALVIFTLLSGRMLSPGGSFEDLRKSPGGDRKNRNRELTARLAVAASTAFDRPTLVVDDILRHESKTFETDFLSLLRHFKKKGRKLIYLSSQMFHTFSLDEKASFQDYESFSIDFDSIRLR